MKKSNLENPNKNATYTIMRGEGYPQRVSRNTCLFGNVSNKQLFHDIVSQKSEQAGVD